LQTLNLLYYTGQLDIMKGMKHVKKVMLKKEEIEKKLTFEVEKGIQTGLLLDGGMQKRLEEVQAMLGTGGNLSSDEVFNFVEQQTTTQAMGESMVSSSSCRLYLNFLQNFFSSMMASHGLVPKAGTQDSYDSLKLKKQKR